MAEEKDEGEAACKDDGQRDTRQRVSVISLTTREDRQGAEKDVQ